MRRGLILILLCGSAALAAPVPDDELAAVVGGNDYIGIRYLYENFGVQVGQYSEQVCVRECPRGCLQWADRDAQLYEAVALVPISGAFYLVGTLGVADVQDGIDAAFGAGAEWRWRHLTVGGTWSSATQYTGSIGWAAAW